MQHYDEICEQQMHVNLSIKLYTHRMFTAFFQEEQNIRGLVLAKLAEELGLDRQGFRMALETGRAASAIWHRYGMSLNDAHYGDATFVSDGQVLFQRPNIGMTKRKEGSLVGEVTSP